MHFFVNQIIFYAAKKEKRELILSLFSPEIIILLFFHRQRGTNRIPNLSYALRRPIRRKLCEAWYPSEADQREALNSVRKYASRRRNSLFHGCTI